MIRVQNAIILLSLTSVCGSAGAQSPTPLASSCEGVTAIQIADKDIIAAPRNDRMLALINFAPVIASVAKQEQPCKLTVTAAKVAAEKMASSSAQRFQKIEVILSLVENMDEYARPNYAGMRHIGRMTFERTDGSLKLTQQSLQLDP